MTETEAVPLVQLVRLDMPIGSSPSMHILWLTATTHAIQPAPLVLDQPARTVKDVTMPTIGQPLQANVLHAQLEPVDQLILWTEPRVQVRQSATKHALLVANSAQESGQLSA